MFMVATVSNKGGCGKSMVASNLALELKSHGYKVGILDADIDSPYMSELTRAEGKIGLDAERRMIPVQWNGMPLMSFALWVPDQFQGATMQGDMHDRWIEDALTHTDWGDVEILVIDLPAGTGDEVLAVKRVAGKKLLGFIAVALPNVIGGLRRVYNTAQYHHIRILGVIENMSGQVFGTGHVEEFCLQNKLQFLGAIPLDPRIRERHEQGNPAIPDDLLAPIRRARGLITHPVTPRSM